MKKSKSLKDIRNDPRVDSIHKESFDMFSSEFSWWCLLKPGFQAYNNQQHIIHEDTIKKICIELEYVEVWMDDPDLK